MIRLCAPAGMNDQVVLRREVHGIQRGQMPEM